MFGRLVISKELLKELWWDDQQHEVTLNPFSACSQHSCCTRQLLMDQRAPTRQRTYTDYETVDECLEGGHQLVRTCESHAPVPVGICKIYEEHLRQLHPHSSSITYDISELFMFVDNLHDLSCLV